MLDKIERILARFEEIEHKMADPQVCKNRAKMEELGRAHSELLSLVRAGNEYRKLKSHLAELDDLAEDPELGELAHEERPGVRQRIEELEEELQILLIPKDPDEDRNAIMEIRAGTGGEEAALFAGDLFRMYSRYLERRGWGIEMMHSNPTELGGFKEIIFLVKGKGAYGALRYEGGVHRVQRIPATEAGGRIHTSAVSVAVLPEAEEVDVQISEEDIRIDVYRSSGPGGQSVNTTDSAVRITHIPTGLVVSIQDEKSQHKNRAKAMKVLQSRLLEREREAAHSERDTIRRSLIKSGDRSDRVRTYNFPQSRLTDHRIGYTSHNLPQLLDGEIDDLLQELMRHDQMERMEASAGSAVEEKS